MLYVVNADDTSNEQTTDIWNPRFIQKRINHIKTAGLVDIEFPVEEIQLSPEDELFYKTKSQPPVDTRKPIELSEERKALTQRVALKKAYGEMSLHPWYPNNRETLDAWWLTIDINPFK